MKGSGSCLHNVVNSHYTTGIPKYLDEIGFRTYLDSTKYIPQYPKYQCFMRRSLNAGDRLYDIKIACRSWYFSDYFGWRFARPTARRRFHWVLIQLTTIKARGPYPSGSSARNGLPALPDEPKAIVFLVVPNSVAWILDPFSSCEMNRGLFYLLPITTERIIPIKLLQQTAAMILKVHFIVFSF